ncbi:MAG: accessory factor UbiK family protein [Rhodocyclaceae bacterium]|nr:accessory factor UbiK family protein [Rhodocyclaceae bacterium]
MIRPEMLNDLAARLSALVATSPAKDLEKNARALLGGLFSQFDLVAREEFEVQVTLLEKAEQRLRALEARIAELEQRG